MELETDETVAELTPLQKAHAAMKARRDAGETIVRLTPVERAAKKPTSLRLAITARCYQCMGEDHDPGVRKRVAECAVKTCALNPVRPWQRAAEDDGSDEAEGE